MNRTLVPSKVRVNYKKIFQKHNITPWLMNLNIAVLNEDHYKIIHDNKKRVRKYYAPAYIQTALA